MKSLLSFLFRLRNAPAKVRGVCPVCASPDTTFLPLPEFYRQEAAKSGYKHFGRGETIALETYSCATCGASDRERLYAWWIDAQIRSGHLKKGSALLHFAPEAALSRMLRELHYFEYNTADYGMEGVDYQLDIMSMPFADDSFDFFICSHVLEHVESDDRAIRELCRITRPGGCGILMAPICLDIAHTLEDPSITSEAERWQYYGQNDHVRLYAHDDYVAKISSNGFAVEQLGIDHFGRETFRQLGLTDSTILYIARKA